MYEELYDLLCELGLGAAARPLCDLFTDLAGEPMSLPLLQQEIRNVLRAHSGERLVDEVIARLIAHGFAGLSRKSFDGEVAGEAAAHGAAVRESSLLSGTIHTIVVEPSARRVVHETARGWLDIDGGIYVDLRQHAAGTDSER